MLISELFKDTTREFEVYKNTDLVWASKAKLSDGRLLALICSQYVSDGETPYWELPFSVDGDFDKTGKGSEIEIFGTVVAMLEQFQKDKIPVIISMQAAEENRSKLYLRMLKRGLPNWKIVGVNWQSTHVISATRGNEFPVVNFGDDGAVVDFGPLSFGFQDGEPDFSLSDSDSAKLKSEFEKAARWSLDEE